MDDLRCAGVDFLTIGQYLQPTPKHVAVDRYVEPAEFDEFKRIAQASLTGGRLVAVDPVVLSRRS